MRSIIIDIITSGLHVVFSERERSLCRRASVCRLSVCNVRAPYSAD